MTTRKGLSTSTMVYKVDGFQTPGPGSYVPPSDFGQATAWTIKHKYPATLRTNRAGSDQLPSTVGTGRKYSLSSRHAEPKNDVPGPTYVPPDFGSRAKTSAFHQRIGHWGIRDPVGPGPGKYQTRTAGMDGVKYTLKARQFPANTGGPAGPGGGQYIPDYDRVLPKSPVPAIHERHRPLSSLSTPGPGQYPIDRSPESHPASFHRKLFDPTEHAGPGPAQYDTRVRTGSQTPGYSMRWRLNVKREVLRPHYHKTPDPMGSGSPKWSMFVKHLDRDWTNSPGPKYVPPDFGENGR
jgi:hypothetical protein